jgi:hypothetical protein
LDPGWNCPCPFVPTFRSFCQFIAELSLIWPIRLCDLNIPTIALVLKLPGESVYLSSSFRKGQEHFRFFIFHVNDNAAFYHYQLHYLGHSTPQFNPLGYVT